MSRLFRELLEAIVLALFVFFVIHISLQNFKVVGASMEDTLQEGQFLVVIKILYTRIDLGRLGQLIPFWEPDRPREVFALHPPERGDIIVFHPPHEPNREFVKRVVGLPGERVSIKDGQLLIAGESLPSSYSIGLSSSENQIFAPLGNDDYFVLGDNRGQSTDSRDWGPVPLDNIIGKVWVIYWPFSDIGFLGGLK